MCRPDDFPPYPTLQDLELADPDYRGPAVPADDGPRATPLGSFPVAFRTLDEAEERRFRSWARENWTPGTPVNPLWHPVVRDECERMAQEGKER